MLTINSTYVCNHSTDQSSVNKHKSIKLYVLHEKSFRSTSSGLHYMYLIFATYLQLDYTLLAQSFKINVKDKSKRCIIMLYVCKKRILIMINDEWLIISQNVCTLVKQTSFSPPHSTSIIYINFLAIINRCKPLFFINISISILILFI